MATKVSVAGIRKLHAHLSTVLAEYDARKSGGETDGEDGAGSGLGAKTLMERDQPVKQDDPAEFPGSPKRPVTNGNQLAASAQDSGAGIRNPSNGRTQVVQVFDTPRNPKDLKAIQPSEGVRALHAIAEQFAADSKARSDALFK